MNDELNWVLQLSKERRCVYKARRRPQTHVYNLCYRMLGEPEAAEDAAQESFLRAYQNLHRYDRARPFATWLVSIAAHYCIDRLRRRKLSIFSIDEENDDGSTYEIADPASLDPEAESVKREDRDHLHILLKDLDETDRAAVIMRYWYDFSEIEIANSLKLTVSAVKSRLHRSRRALAGMWQEDELREPRTRTKRSPHESPSF